MSKKWNRTPMADQDQTKTPRTVGTEKKLKGESVASPESDSATLQQSVPKGTKKKAKAAGDKIRSTINNARDNRTRLGTSKPSTVVEG
jgi:hypothetical protein